MTLFNPLVASRLFPTSTLFKRLNKSLTHKNQIFKSLQKQFSKRRIHGNPTGVDPNVNRDVETWRTLKSVLPFLWPKDRPDIKKKVILSFILLILAKCFNIVTPYCFKIIVDTLTENKTVKNLDPAKIAQITVFAVILGYGLSRFGSSLFNELKNALFARVSQGSIRQVSVDSFKHMQELNLSFHLNRRTGMISKSIDRGTRGISFILTAMAFNLIPTSFEIFMVSALMGAYFGSPFAFTTLSCVTGYGIFTYLVTKWRTKYRVIMNLTDNECGAKAVDNFINYETVKYFNNEDFELQEYDKILKRYEEASRQTISSLSMLNFGQNTIFTIGLVATMMLAASQIITGSLTVGDLVMMNSLLFQLSIPLNFLGSTYRDVRQSLVDLESLFNLLKNDKKIKDAPDSVKLNWPARINEGDPVIEFRNVSFSYENHSVLKDLSFVVPYRQKVAIVGGSGSGKSTIVRLLYRFMDPDAGSISILGQDIRKMTLASLRQAISVVPQDQVLFHNTILYNVKYGKISSSMEDVYRATNLSGLHNTIMKFPNGYHTQVGERGLKLSGGEKQRVAIARAILKDSPILVYDEATSSLDSITEKKIMAALSKILRDRTSLVIAHRLSTIVDSDIILVLKDGKILEQGKHIDLLINNPLGTYSQLWSKQHEKPIIQEKSDISENIEDVMNDIGCSKEGCCSK